jgi:hypothetical protein
MGSSHNHEARKTTFLPQHEGSFDNASKAIHRRKSINGSSTNQNQRMRVFSLKKNVNPEEDQHVEEIGKGVNQSALSSRNFLDPKPTFKNLDPVLTSSSSGRKKSTSRREEWFVLSWLSLCPGPLWQKNTSTKCTRKQSASSSSSAFGSDFFQVVFNECLEQAFNLRVSKNLRTKNHVLRTTALALFRCARQCRVYTLLKSISDAN